tara:strand:+ start:157 stop:684 length:528 start_codon:yes stop_codon:yes gene_type:complete
MDDFASKNNDKTYLIHHRHIEWKKLPSPYNTYWTFCVVRNPWSRLVSRYNYDVSAYLQKYLAGEGDYFLKVYNKLQKGFDYWIKNDVYTLPLIEHRMKWQNQCEIIDGCKDIHILRYENINADFKLLQNKLKWNEPLPHANATVECDYKKYYNDELINIVADHYRQDIKEFGFTF